ncbi:ankyrin repeat-containing protein NPR4 [Brachypodium distachyon]|uniref:PGG domain-containing protein n=1 Tax=Brachypodium distachyon TaxID=15368 RepID=A0A0Q3K717_BRADI|nr:ankyrin repeat-containing protein NPR4 [Brachypodium distachyon]XP_024313025.1 ankyrin repeat-containing protein NPR4 [Brachypodium distachyon]XP_024313026.1 ankyrin repeat-containing protein NPR4 [Brachypodium distachyon]KQK20340.1 hypothetical protein BRADI_1g53900v3 [Brachypodium distachyon]PNT76818.1 hypothetical protein BRADI_1g53900v3 [Brachypodium distachyon]PNT76819.1 hypothetical protein BRADI_1g53900v3 [Brachypodium distachyon]|eukprot:XP_003557376.1 ankyrin repeat-containing protein NPR4 [Brachypodium distachyon]
MAANTSTTTSSSGGMDKRLLQAATSGDSTSMKAMASQDPSVLLGRTPSGNTCLHISSIHGHQEFCKDVITLEESLLTAVNSDKETPFLAAVACGRVNLASVLLRCYRVRRLNEAILQEDKDGCNVLHHAIRSSHREFAMELIAAEPALSKGVNQFEESPMFIAAMRGFAYVCEELLQIHDSAHVGELGFNALHAAVEYGSPVIAKRIMDKRPGLAREGNMEGSTPVTMAVILKKIDVLRVLLEHDSSLGYEVNEKGFPLLSYAAYRGHVDVARELLKHCPDAPYRQVGAEAQTCFHTAVCYSNTEFVEFIMSTPQLRKLINIRDNKGKTALHYAVRQCSPKIVAALLSHNDIDTTMLDKGLVSATRELSGVMNEAKTVNWNEVCMLMLKANPQDSTSIYNLNEEAKKHTTLESRKQAKSLTQTYTTNTSLVAILIVTITFAAAFTLPGGYSNDAGNEGLPVMSKKFAFQAFLVSDILAMCSSFVVAFICIIARWEDYEFLIYYRSFTKKLMWFAYVATTTAFSTGLYTVMAQRLRWLAIATCILIAMLPILTKLLGEWPVLKLRFRLGKTYKSDLLEMV